MKKFFALMFVIALASGAALACGGHTCSGDKAVTGDKAAADHKCGEACPAHGKEIVKTTENATVLGTIKCMHCDLHKANRCQKVLVTADSKIYQFCPDTLKDIKLEKLSGKEVTAKGTVQEIKDGDCVIHLTSLEIKS